MSQWKAKAELLLRMVAEQDLEGVPVYIVAKIDLDQTFLGKPSWGAWTSNVGDIELMGILEPQGLWQGRGFGMVLDESKLISEPDRLGACLHELAHFLDQAPLYKIELDENALRAFAVALQANRTTKAIQPPVEPKEPPPWAGHGERFVRACCHLAHRAGQVLESIQPKHLRFGATYYGQRGTENVWMQSLASELDDTRPIRAILDSDAPLEFLKRYDDATAWWRP